MFYIVFTIGLFGGLHCVGMCGPLNLAAAGMPLTHRAQWIAYRTLYQLGRIFSYAFLGFFIALLGKGFALGGWQNMLSLAMGIFIILYFVLPLGLKIKSPTFWQKAIHKLKTAFSKNLKKNSAGSQLSMGVLNGLLPCGLVYLALATAALGDSPWEGALMMAFFGLGTMPWLLGVLLLGSLGSMKWRLQISKFTPYLAMFLAVILILRGLDIHWLHLPMLGMEDTVEICE